jgi:hypothetical protein
MNIRARLLACELVRLRAEFARMVANGICDDCQSNRMEAAQEYENAVAQVRLVAAMGGRWSNTRPPVIHPALAEAVQRRNAADAWCVRLKMWPADRPHREETA